MPTTPETQLRTFPCHSCGARLEFTPAGGPLQCPVCLAKNWSVGAPGAFCPGRVAIVWGVFFAEGIALALAASGSGPYLSPAFGMAVLLGAPTALVLAVALRRKHLGLVIPLGIVWVLFCVAFVGVFIGDLFIMCLLIVSAAPVGWAVLPNHHGLPDPRLCSGCGYSLAGLPGNTCPECGKQRAGNTGKYWPADAETATRSGYAGKQQ